MHLIDEFIKNEEDAKRALIGTIFADGSIERQRTPKGRGSCEITHTARNIDYLQVKKEIFEKIPGFKCTIKEKNKKIKEKEYQLFRLCTNRTDWLTVLRDDLYEITKEGKRVKHFRKKYIDQMSDLGLLFLYLDDGCLRAKCRSSSKDVPTEFRITFCLESFTLDELNYFRKWLKEKYDVDSKVYHHYKYNDHPELGYRVWTNTTNTKKLMKVFDKFYNLVPSMRYKFVKYYPS